MLDEAARARLRRRELGIVLQFGQLVPDLALLDNVALPLLLDGRPPVEARSAARDRGAALVLVTHANVVAARADREVRLRDGAVEHDVRLS